MSNALVGLLTLRLQSLGWVFLASSLRLRFSFLPWTFISSLFACCHSRAGILFVFYHAVLLVFPERPPCPALSKYQQSSCFTILWVYEYFCSTPSPLVLENWVVSSLSFGTRFWVLAVSGFFRTYLTFNFLARFHFSVSYSASVKGIVANSMLLLVPNDCSQKVSQSIAVFLVHSSLLAWISSVHIDKEVAWLSFRKIYVLLSSFSKSFVPITDINFLPTIS